MIAVISIGIANMLVLLRVVILWDEHPVRSEIFPQEDVLMPRLSSRQC